MASPWVNLLSNEAGGGLNAAMGANNALANANVLRQINQIVKQYKPITSQAEAASKLAYANLMGPQFLAKLLGSDSAVANMGSATAKAALQKAVGAGFGQGTGINTLNQMQQGNGIFSGIGQPSTNSFAGYIKNAFKGLIGNNDSNNAAPVNNNALIAPSQNYNNSNPNVTYDGPGPINNGSPFVGRQGYKPESIQPRPGEPIQGEGSLDPDFDKAYSEWQKTPEAQREFAKGEQANIPSNMEELNAWYRNNGMILPSVPKKQPTWAENTGTLKGIQKEGEELGAIRAKDIEGLNNTVFNAETNATTLNDINNILGSQEFEQIRNVPLAGHHELAYYAKEGTPAQQAMVGRYYTLTGNLIKDASRDFAGQFRKGEQALLQGMKPSPSDTVDTAKGKAAVLTELNKMLMERSRLTSKYIEANHANKLEASEWADKHVNGEKIRQEINDTLNPTVTLRDPKTGKTITIQRKEARKRGVKNV